MPKCQEAIRSVQGINFYLELKNPEKDCEINKQGRQYRIIVENFRPNSIEIEQESVSVDQHVVFGNPSSYDWSARKKVTRRRNNNPSTKRCSETAYSDDPGNDDTIESEIRYKDILPNIKTSFDCVSDKIEVNVC